MSKTTKMTLGEMLKRKDFALSTNVERALFQMLIDSGIDPKEIQVGCKYDTPVSDAKERIYKEFSKMFGFKYKWDGFYEIK